MPVLLALLLAVTLGAPFGRAEARALTADGGLTVEVSVAVDDGRAAVLARPVSAAGELPPVALADQGDGRWVGILRLSGREDVQVAFEAIDAAGASDISALSSLTDLGVDPAVIAPSLPTRPPAPDPGPNWWLIGAVVAGLAALALTAVWVAGAGVDKRSNNLDNSKDVDQTGTEPADEA